MVTLACCEIVLKGSWSRVALHAAYVAVGSYNTLQSNRQYFGKYQLIQAKRSEHTLHRRDIDFIWIMRSRSDAGQVRNTAGGTFHCLSSGLGFIFLVFALYASKSLSKPSSRTAQACCTCTNSCSNNFLGVVVLPMMASPRHRITGASAATEEGGAWQKNNQNISPRHLILPKMTCDTPQSNT